ncbi:MAG: tRNA (5-methylaminomethyl-2-thiouridine)(34)-methyltransferase MnmD [Flavobacteriales bacterium]
MNDSKADITIIETSDGSHSLFVPSLNETYHSRHGAMQESEWVFIKHGLDFARPPALNPATVSEIRIRILEVGFGTGLNALLGMRWAEGNDIHVHFTSLETNIIPLEVALQLNYCDTDIGRGQAFERGSDALTNPRGQQDRERFLRMHASSCNEDIAIAPHFTLHKALRDVQSESSNEQYDIVFFDAFGPPTQPEMWLPEIFMRMFDALKPGAILVTYCAKGQVRRDMQSVGFTVERLPGPPGKREMLRATKPMIHE